MNADFNTLKRLYDDVDFTKILSYTNGLFFLKLVSISRPHLLKDFCNKNSLQFEHVKPTLEFIFKQNIPNEKIDDFICNQFVLEMNKNDNDDIYDQIYRIDILDWGGLYQNGLERTIVNNYVKKIANYDILIKKIESTLFESVIGYVKASWYNYWTSVLIEDMFKTHPNIIPAIGKIKHIDFFWNDIPLDLKVTFVPNTFMIEQRHKLGMKSELIDMKNFAKKHHISYNKSDPERIQFRILYKKIYESELTECKKFMRNLKLIRQNTLDTIMKNPYDLVKWLYENQGERRFDSTYRFYLILVDTNDFVNSWKLKRNRDLVPNKINDFLNSDIKNKLIPVEFQRNGKTFNTKCCILFIKK